MSDLIHANDLLKKVMSLQSLDGMEVVSRHQILIAPEVDAVEVVRCKDCVSWNKKSDKYRSDGTCDCLVKYHDAERHYTEEDHFCSYGERRKNEVKEIIKKASAKDENEAGPF